MLFSREILLIFAATLIADFQRGSARNVPQTPKTPDPPILLKALEAPRNNELLSHKNHKHDHIYIYEDAMTKMAKKSKKQAQPKLNLKDCGYVPLRKHNEGAPRFFTAGVYLLDPNKKVQCTSEPKCKEPPNLRLCLGVVVSKKHVLISRACYDRFKFEKKHHQVPKVEVVAVQTTAMVYWMTSLRYGDEINARFKATIRRDSLGISTPCNRNVSISGADSNFVVVQLQEKLILGQPVSGACLNPCRSELGDKPVVSGCPASRLLPSCPFNPDDFTNKTTSAPIIASTSTSLSPSTRQPTTTTSWRPSSSQAPTTTTSSPKPSSSQRPPTSASPQPPVVSSSKKPMSSTSLPPTTSTSKLPSTSTSKHPTTTTSKAQTTSSSKSPTTTTTKAPTSSTSKAQSTSTSKIPTKPTTTPHPTTTGHPATSCTSLGPTKSSTSHQPATSSSSRQPTSSTSHHPKTSHQPATTSSKHPTVTSTTDRPSTSSTSHRPTVKTDHPSSTSIRPSTTSSSALPTAASLKPTTAASSSKPTSYSRPPPTTKPPTSSHPTTSLPKSSWLPTVGSSSPSTIPPLLSLDSVSPESDESEEPIELSIKSSHHLRSKRSVSTSEHCPEFFKSHRCVYIFLKTLNALDQRDDLLKPVEVYHDIRVAFDLRDNPKCREQFCSPNWNSTSPYDIDRTEMILCIGNDEGGVDPDMGWFFYAMNSYHKVEEPVFTRINQLSKNFMNNFKDCGTNWG